MERNGSLEKLQLFGDKLSRWFGNALSCSQRNTRELTYSMENQQRHNNTNYRAA